MPTQKRTRQTDRQLVRRTQRQQRRRLNRRVLRQVEHILRAGRAAARTAHGIVNPDGKA